MLELWGYWKTRLGSDWRSVDGLSDQRALHLLFKQRLLLLSSGPSAFIQIRQLVLYE